jgi:hypothetical protein
MTPAILLALTVLALLLGLRLGRWRRSRRSKARNRIARRGEERAALLLQRAGYAVVDRGAVAEIELDVDGAPVKIEVRADLIVRCPRGVLRVAEVKTGTVAPDLRHGPTRRQLLEYALAFDSPTVLLVDMEAEEIHEVAFAL